MKGLKWEFVVVDQPDANAFVVPGGKVVVFTGLERMLNDEELAAVMAHEVSHVVARHQAERMTQTGVYQMLRIFMYLMFGLSIPYEVFSVGFFLPHSRQAETEADLIGLRLMAHACFDPRASVTMLQKLGRLEQQ